MTGNHSTRLLDLPINEIVTDGWDPRVAKPSDAADAELAASIKAHGLLQPLVVSPHEPGGQWDGKYRIVAGRRRLRALKELASAGDWPQRHVPCYNLFGCDLDAERSIAENTQRVNLHPADQAEAFNRLSEAGASLPQIAASFGLTEMTVRQNMKLAALHDDVRQGYRDGRVSGTVARALTTCDAETQKTVLDTASADQLASAHLPWGIKSKIEAEGMPACHKLAIFIGVAVYLKAGGKITDDLFAQSDSEDLSRLADPQLVERLAAEKLETVTRQEMERIGAAEYRTVALNENWFGNELYQHDNPQRDPDDPAKLLLSDEDQARAIVFGRVNHDGQAAFEVRLRRDTEAETAEREARDAGIARDRDEWRQARELTLKRTAVVQRLMLDPKNVSAAFDFLSFAVFYTAFLDDRYDAEVIGLTIGADDVEWYDDKLAETAQQIFALHWNYEATNCDAAWEHWKELTHRQKDRLIVLAVAGSVLSNGSLDLPADALGGIDWAEHGCEPPPKEEDDNDAD